MATALPTFTAEEARDNRALGSQSRRRSSEVKNWLRGVLKDQDETFRENPDENYSAITVALYGVLGNPWSEDEDGEFSPITFKGGVGTGLDRDLSMFADETIELSTLAREKDGSIKYEEQVDEDGKPRLNDDGEPVLGPVYGDPTTFSIADAITVYLLGIKEDGVPSKGGIKAIDLLALVPKVGKVSAEKWLSESGISSPEKKYARSLTQGQYEALLLATGVEDADEDEIEDDELDDAAEEFEDDADEVEAEDEATDEDSDDEGDVEEDEDVEDADEAEDDEEELEEEDEDEDDE